jgi:hypothetical protein
MNDEKVLQLMRELKTVRICAVVSTVTFVLAFVWYILGIRL